MDIKEKLVEIIAKYLDVEENTIRTDAHFTDLGLDSLDVAELVMQIEDELGVSVELTADLDTLDKLAEYIDSQL